MSSMVKDSETSNSTQSLSVKKLTSNIFKLLSPNVDNSIGRECTNLVRSSSFSNNNYIIDKKETPLSKVSNYDNLSLYSKNSENSNDAGIADSASGHNNENATSSKVSTKFITDYKSQMNRVMREVEFYSKSKKKTIDAIEECFFRIYEAENRLNTISLSHDQCMRKRFDRLDNQIRDVLLLNQENSTTVESLLSSITQVECDFININRTATGVADLMISLDEKPSKLITDQEISSIKKDLSFISSELKSKKSFFAEYDEKNSNLKDYASACLGFRKKVEKTLKDCHSLIKKIGLYTNTLKKFKFYLNSEQKQCLLNSSRFYDQVDKLKKHMVKEELNLAVSTNWLEIRKNLKKSIESSRLVEEMTVLGRKLTNFFAMLNYRRIDEKDVLVDFIELFKLFTLKNKLKNNLAKKGLKEAEIKEIKKHFVSLDSTTTKIKFWDNLGDSSDLTITLNKIFEIEHKYCDKNIPVNYEIVTSYLVYSELRNILSEAEHSFNSNEIENNSNRSDVDLGYEIDLGFLEQISLGSDSERVRNVILTLDKRISNSQNNLIEQRSIFNKVKEVYEKNLENKGKMRRHLKLEEEHMEKIITKVSSYFGHCQKMEDKLRSITNNLETLNNEESRVTNKDLYKFCEKYLVLSETAKRLNKSVKKLKRKFSMLKISSQFSKLSAF